MRTPSLALAWAFASTLVSIARPAFGQAAPAPDAPAPDAPAPDAPAPEAQPEPSEPAPPPAGAPDANAAPDAGTPPAGTEAPPADAAPRPDAAAPPPVVSPSPDVAPETAASPAEQSEDEIPEFEATANVEALPKDPTRRELTPETIRRVAGTRGDVLKSVEILPGVARPIEGGNPILRGAAGYESATFLNGTPVPFLYHFGGLASFMSPYLVERLELRPSNFSARYGRVAGGVVEIRAKDPESPKLRAIVDLNLIDSSAYVEVPLGESAGVAAAVRRSNIDFFFENFVPEDAYSVVAAPVYFDYQSIARIDLGPNTRLRLLTYGGRDSLELFIADTGDDPAISGGIKGSIAFHRAGVELESRADRVSGSISATLGYTDILQQFGELEQTVAGPELNARGELSFELVPELELTLGSDVWVYSYDGVYRGPVPGQLEGDPKESLPLGAGRLVSAADDSIAAVNPGGYLELTVRPTRALVITPGLRVDYFGAFRHVSTDPRLAARYELTPGTTLKGGLGSFTQAPEFWQALDAVGNPNLDPYRAIHASAGVEQLLGDSVELGVEGFYKHLLDVAVATPNREAPFYTNEGEGRIYGGELSLEANWPLAGYGYLAYTLSRSERRDSEAGGYRLFDADQTHILSLTGSQGLGKGFEVGARFRLVSGNPMTPITGSVYDARTGLYIPTFGDTNSTRNPAFHQLDVRFEKQFDLRPVKLAAYVDVQNVYNAKNQEGVRHSFDYRESEAVTGLPLFPSIGFRGEL